MISDVPDDVIQAWMTYEVSLINPSSLLAYTSLLELIKLSDTDKSARVKIFLQSQVDSKQAEIDIMPANTQATIDSLQSDIISYNNIIQGLS